MIAGLLLAAAVRCASHELCPSDANLVQALIRYEDASSYEASRELTAESPGQIVMVHAQRILGVADVHCDEPLANKQMTNCSFKVHFAGRTAQGVAKVQRDTDGWTITNALFVTLQPRGRTREAAN